MPAGTQTYNRNTPSPKFYSSAVVGKYGYNPTITHYYDSSDHLMRIEEVFDGVMYSQTISGATISGANHFTMSWPNYSYKIIYNAWAETTVS